MFNHSNVKFKMKSWTQTLNIELLDKSFEGPKVLDLNVKNGH